MTTSAREGSGGRHGAGSTGVTPLLALRPMTAADLDVVMPIEVAAYPFPWSRGNFVDSLAAGHPAWLLSGANQAVLGYFVAMPGVAEWHLLTLTVAPAVQRQGHGSYLVAALVRLARADAAAQLWLEVRASNAGARALYERLGFAPVGVRKLYYPAPHGKREDAVVMSLQIDAAAESNTAADTAADTAPARHALG